MQNKYGTALKFFLLLLPLLLLFLFLSLSLFLSLAFLILEDVSLTKI